MADIPEDLKIEVAPAAQEEGFRPIESLQRDWDSGENRFSKPGEAFYVARFDGRLVGLCGLNQDPYVDDASIGRLRRLYVLPSFRRMGVGSRLVRQALRYAKEHFAVVRLRTLNEEPAVFFEAVGFGSISDEQAVTHEIRLERDFPQDSQ